jgi:hypothetical protein
MAMDVAPNRLFAGTFELAESPDDTLDMDWRLGEEFVRLKANLASCEQRLEYSRGGRVERLDLDGLGGSNARKRKRVRGSC